MTSKLYCIPQSGGSRMKKNNTLYWYMSSKWICVANATLIETGYEDTGLVQLAKLITCLCWCTRKSIWTENWKRKTGREQTESENKESKRKKSSTSTLFSTHYSKPSKLREPEYNYAKAKETSHRANDEASELQVEWVNHQEWIAATAFKDIH